jgi:hypothetical protein
MLNHCVKTVPLVEEGLARPVALAANDLAIILQTVEVYNPSGRFISVKRLTSSIGPCEPRQNIMYLPMGRQLDMIDTWADDLCNVEQSKSFRA